MPLPCFPFNPHQSSWGRVLIQNDFKPATFCKVPSGVLGNAFASWPPEAGRAGYSPSSLVLASQKRKQKPSQPLHFVAHPQSSGFQGTHAMPLSSLKPPRLATQPWRAEGLRAPPLCKSMLWKGGTWYPLPSALRVWTGAGSRAEGKGRDWSGISITGPSVTNAGDRPERDESETRRRVQTSPVEGSESGSPWGPICSPEAVLFFF